MAAYDDFRFLCLYFSLHLYETVYLCTPLSVRLYFFSLFSLDHFPLWSTDALSVSLGHTCFISLPLSPSPPLGPHTPTRPHPYWPVRMSWSNIVLLIYLPQLGPSLSADSKLLILSRLVSPVACFNAALSTPMQLGAGMCTVLSGLRKLTSIL